ncbi:DUF4214 domain-containing protein [Undibacterium sp. Ji42W]|uniref:DUF4214 domain-containing protein n=1 Tax=Undibacterium sp. Ji42W TaxID=3413039 RepID=UPI003BF2C253
MATEVEIQNLYIAYFNRPADKAGLAYWKDANLSILQIAQSFSEQKEYATAFAGFTAEQTINALYNNLFNHKADADGLTYWSGQIKSGKISIGAAAIAILNGATGADQMAVQSKNAAAIAFTKKLVADPLADYAYNLGGAAFNTAKSWLAPVIDIPSGIDAINNLGSMTEKLTASAAYGNDKLTGAVLVPVLAGQNNIGSKSGDFYFTADDSQLLASNTKLTGNGAAVALNVNSFFTPVSHSSAVVTGVQTLNLQAGADTSNAGNAFLSSFTTINANRISGGDNIVLGNLSGQTVNLNNQSGTSTVTLGGINQIVKQASAQASSVVKSSIANLKGASFNFSNTGTGEHVLDLADGNGFTLDRVNMTGLNKIILRGTDDTYLDITPSRDLSISLSSSKNVTIAAKGGQNVSISGVKAYGLTLSGNSKFTVENSQFSSIDLYDKGSTLTVKDTNSEDHSIYSAAPTKLDMSNGAGGTIKFAGAGSFDITGAGNKANAFFYEMGTSGDISLTTAGSNLVGFYEVMGTGAVTINHASTGTLSFSANSSHSSNTVNMIQPGSSIWIFGNGGLVNVIEAEGKTGKFNYMTGSNTPSNIKLAQTGGGNDILEIKFSTMETIKTALCTISNFNVAGSDRFSTGTKATSLSKISIGNSDFSSLASNIASSAAGAGQSLSATAGQAYLITVGNGEAAGTYLYQHTSATANTVDRTDIIVKLVGASQFTAADILDYAL